VKVCLSTDAIGYPEGGGHLWAYLNWARGFRQAGCDVVWLERAGSSGACANVPGLKSALRPYGLADAIALYSRAGEFASPVAADCLDVDEAVETCDLLVNLRYDTPPEVVGRFRRSALIDIDPGLLQVWLSRREVRFVPHDVYFTTGSTVGTAAARFSNFGLAWHYTPPPVSLRDWPSMPDGGSFYTTVSHWWGASPDDSGQMEVDGSVFANQKRTSFLEFVDLPSRVDVGLELAVCLGSDEEERSLLETRGWQVVDSWRISSTPDAYRAYIQGSRGEFSCAKPSCVHLENGWIGDRTPCYLASGKPAVVQYTGPVSFLEEGAGVLRFRTQKEASSALAAVEADYERHSRQARQLAEEYFDACKVAERVLEVALL
jgi:hypothetical protein